MEKPLWTHYRVQWKFLTQLCSSVPADPNLMDMWLKARSPRVKPPGGRAIQEIHEEIVATLAEPEEDLESRSLLVFQRVNGQLVMRAATVRAHIKDCARIIGPVHVGKIKGEKSWASRVINCTYLDEAQYWIPIVHDDGAPFTIPDGIRDKAIHTWNGSSAIKSFEFVENAVMNFRLKILAGAVSQDDLQTIFSYGGVHGYAGERGDGEGKYQFTITEEKQEYAAK